MQVRSVTESYVFVITHACILDHFGQSTDKVSGVLGAQILRLCWSEAELGISGGCLTRALF